jgi:tetratricopeptide (TPR) repeat protein
MLHIRRLTSPAQRLRAAALSTCWISCVAACLLTSLPSAALEVVNSGGLFAPDAASVKALMDGRDALNAGRLDAALALFKTAAAQSPRDPYPLIGLADVARLRGDAKEARESMARAVALAPAQPVVLLAQAKLMLQQREFSAAEKTFKRVIELGSDPLSARAGLAIALEAQGRRAEAKSALDAIDTKTGKPERLAPVGNGYNAIDEGKRALQIFDQMLAAKINTAEVHVGRGDALQRLNDPGMALAAYQRASELAPKSAALEFRRGLSLERMSRDADAEAAYRSALQLDSMAAGARNNLAQLLARNGIKLEEALQNALRAVEIEPSAALYDTLGAVYVVRGDTELARKAFEQAVAKAPTNAAYRQRLEKVSATNALSTKQVESGLGMVAKPTAPTSAAVVATAAPVLPAAVPASVSKSAPMAAAVAVPPPALAAPSTPVAAAAKSAALATTVAVAATPALMPKAASAAVAVPTPPAKALAAAPAPAPAPAPAAAPAATATATTKPASNDALQAAVVQRMAAWQDAWRNKQVDSYLGFYASSFVPDKLKRATWEQDRRTKLNKPGAIELKMGAPTFEIKDGVIKVSFNQEYASFNYKDTTRKTMTWVQEAGAWRIQRESTL